MSDNEDKTTPLSFTMTVFPSGSVRIESNRGESFTFRNDVVTDGLMYFEDTGALRFDDVEHWGRHESRFRDMRLKDSEGYVWAYVDGMWKYRVEDRWYGDAPIGYYVVDGFTIVNSLD